MYQIPPLTSDILAVNFDAPSSPTIQLKMVTKYQTSHSHGWGFGWYPGTQSSAMVVKDPAARSSEVLTSAIADWSNFRSNIFFCKVRGADDGYGQAETQPFSRSFGGRDWIFMHNGDLEMDALRSLHGRQRRLLEPIAGTDSELAFCELLSQLQGNGGRKLSDIDPVTLFQWFQRFDPLGSADMMISDGQNMAIFQGSNSPKQLSFARLTPPDRPEEMLSPAADIFFDDPRDTYRTAFVVSSSPFAVGEWTPMSPGQMIITNRGALVWDSLWVTGPVDAPSLAQNSPMRPLSQQVSRPLAEMQAEQAQSQSQPASPWPPEPDQDRTGANAETDGASTPLVTNPRSITHAPDGHNLTYRLFELVHKTRYAYSEPVQHSTHLFRLQPVDDPVQEVVHSSLTVSSPTEDVLFEDVFGNRSVHCTINQPYSQLEVTAKSKVKIYETPPDDHSLSRRQSTMPLIWMPWQRQMMTPYLLPPELPEPQLMELTDYAMGFVDRNNSNLLKTIKDINLSIYRDFKYVPGSTSLNTTPFEVYATREGVCQDFANLFICLTRLLSIPSRYRMGYIYTGASYENKIQSDASHAWAEVYLPYVGWRGFDPTNGCMVTQDHIRVACGRNYIDATPTSGTIYKGGGTETLSIDVKMREIQE